MSAELQKARNSLGDWEPLEVVKLLRARAKQCDAELAALLTAAAETIERQDSQLDGYWYEAMYGD